MLMLSSTAMEILKARYLRPGENPDDLFRRVAKSVAMAEIRYGKASDAEYWEEKFYRAISSLEFLPNSPTLMNAGTELGQLSACFVLPVEDSMEDIFQSVKDMAVIQKTGGGTGFSFSHLRAKGDIVRSTNGKASGPVSFMKAFNCATESIKQGGKRRGANMGVLSVNHPDIEEFITCKRDKKSFLNFNISVAATDEFFEKALSGGTIDLVNPRDGKVWERKDAGKLFDLICESAWDSGDPGIIYIDEVNRKNPTPEVGRIEATNPCGEVPLLPYESCNLGSINLSRVVEGGKINWEKLKELVWLGVRFLDDVIEVNKFPKEEIAFMTRSNRKIGLGVMGFAECLIMMKVPYNSKRALEVGDEIMSFIEREAYRASCKLAEERGSFPNIDRSVYRGKPVRNAARTSIAPTGTISMIAGTSPSIEPIFAIAYVKKHILGGREFVEVNPLFLKYAGELTEAQMEEALKTGSIQNIKGIPEDIKRLFVTALDIDPEWHVRVQAVFQRHVDNSVSKTVNLRRDATVEDVRKVFLMGFELKLKGITVFRYGSKGEVIAPGVEHFRLENLYKCDTESCRIV